MNTKEAIRTLKEFDLTEDEQDEIIILLKRGEKIEGELIQFLEKENPYPEDVFLPIPEEDFDKINDLLKKEMGYSIDRLFGNMGRKLYKSIIEIIKEVIK